MKGGLGHFCAHTQAKLKKQGFRQGRSGGGGSDPPLSTTGGVSPLVGKENENILQILLSFQLK